MPDGTLVGVCEAIHERALPQPETQPLCYQEVPRAGVGDGRSRQAARTATRAGRRPAGQDSDIWHWRMGLLD